MQDKAGSRGRREAIALAFCGSACAGHSGARSDQASYWPAGKHFYLDEASEWSGFEFIYIVGGRLTSVRATEKADAASGDYLTIDGLPERAYFRVEEDVRTADGLVAAELPPHQRRRSRR